MHRSLYYILFNLFLYLGFSVPAKAQQLDTLYYNELWQLVSKKSAIFYRVAELDTSNLWFTGKFYDYYSNGKLFMTGQYSRSGLKNGSFKSYYPSGQIYCDGYFDDDMLSGTWNFFYPSGKLKERVSFSGLDFIVMDSNDSTGNQLVKNGTGRWRKTFKGTGGGNLEVTGRYYQIKREGNWRLKNEQGKTVLYETYSDDYFIEGVVLIPETEYYDESKFTSNLFYPGSLRIIESFTVWQATINDYPFLTWLPIEVEDSESRQIQIEKPDKPAHFPLGREMFFKTVAFNLVYPEEARARKISGKVFVEFTVGSDGHLYDIHVLRGIGGGCDQKAVLAIVNAGRWFPAMKNGFPVEQTIVIPVTFRLEQ